MIHILLRLVSSWRGKYEIAGYLGLGIGKTHYCLTEQIKKGTGISPMRWDEVLEQLRKNYDVVGEGYLKPPACWRMYSWAAPPVSFLVSFLNFIERSCAR